VAYVTGWQTPPGIPAKLTHINYAFARIDTEGKAVLPHPGVPDHLQSLRSLKAGNPQRAQARARRSDVLGAEPGLGRSAPRCDREGIQERASYH